MTYNPKPIICENAGGVTRIEANNPVFQHTGDTRILNLFSVWSASSSVRYTPYSLYTAVCLGLHGTSPPAVGHYHEAEEKYLTDGPSCIKILPSNLLRMGNVHGKKAPEAWNRDGFRRIDNCSFTSTRTFPTLENANGIACMAAVDPAMKAALSPTSTRTFGPFHGSKSFRTGPAAPGTENDTSVLACNTQICYGDSRLSHGAAHSGNTDCSSANAATNWSPNGRIAASSFLSFNASNVDSRKRHDMVNF
jgi:hypothetical protein